VCINTYGGTSWTSFRMAYACPDIDLVDLEATNNRWYQSHPHIFMKTGCFMLGRWPTS